ncbi:hypothetical protein [Nostoc sp. DSM 114159]
MVLISHAVSVISCFDIKIDSKHWASGAADIETHHTNHQPRSSSSRHGR